MVVCHLIHVDAEYMGEDKMSATSVGKKVHVGWKGIIFSRRLTHLQLSPPHPRLVASYAAAHSYIYPLATHLRHHMEKYKVSPL